MSGVAVFTIYLFVGFVAFVIDVVAVVFDFFFFFACTDRLVWTINKNGCCIFVSGKLLFWFAPVCHLLSICLYNLFACLFDGIPHQHARAPVQVKVCVDRALKRKNHKLVQINSLHATHCGSIHTPTS